METIKIIFRRKAESHPLISKGQQSRIDHAIRGRIELTRKFFGIPPGNPDQCETFIKIANGSLDASVASLIKGFNDAREMVKNKTLAPSNGVTLSAEANVDRTRNPVVCTIDIFGVPGATRN